MPDLILEWAGRERVFRLPFGGVLDLEEACDSPIGAIFLRLSGGTFGIKDVYHPVRLALIGGGLSQLEAKRLVGDRIEGDPLFETAAVAGAILRSIMFGVEPAADTGDRDGATQTRYKFSEISQICREFNMSPADLRALPYADFLNLVVGFNAATAGQGIDAPSEDEYLDMLNRSQGAADV